MTAEVAIIVPVMRRPQNAAPFMESLAAADVDAEVYAVCDPGDLDTQRAWLEAGAVVLLGLTGSRFAEKVNFGYQYRLDEPWVFIVGDDVRFDVEWWRPIRHIQIHQPDTKVIGTNDCSGSAADFSPHVVIAADYIDEQGASWDGPGVVCHEGYRHNFVDNEIIHLAKQRGVWFMCHESRVEHLHPAWRKGVSDEVYELGNESANSDRLLFDARVRMFG